MGKGTDGARSRSTRRRGRVKGQRTRAAYREHRENNHKGRLAESPSPNKAHKRSVAATNAEHSFNAQYDPPNRAGRAAYRESKRRKAAEAAEEVSS